MIIIKNSKIAKLLRVNGIVLHPFIFFADTNPHQELINHELIHVAQIKRDGWLMFYGKYAKEYLKNRFQKMSHEQAYRSISYEREAYQNQHDQDYLA